MVDATGCLVGCVEELEIVLVGAHVAVDEVNSCVGGVEFFGQGFAGLVEDVAEEDVGADGVEDADEGCAYTIGSLRMSIDGLGASSITDVPQSGRLLCP